jgi:hypothetical protein
MKGDVLIDSETHVVTSSTSRSNPSAKSSRDVHRGRVCVYAFIGMGVRLYRVSKKKNSVIQYNLQVLNLGRP